jgi:hypothetical protein
VAPGAGYSSTAVAGWLSEFGGEPDGLSAGEALTVALGEAPLALAAGVGAGVWMGATPAVLTTEPSGAKSSCPPDPTWPRTVEASAGGVGVDGPGGGVGAVPNVICKGAWAVAPEAARSAG